MAAVPGSSGPKRGRPLLGPAVSPGGELGSGHAFDGDHAAPAVGLADGGGGLVVVGAVPGVGGFEALELQHDDAGGPLAFPLLRLAAPGEEAAAVLGDALSGERRGVGIALRVLDVDFDDPRAAHPRDSLLGGPR